MDAHDQSSLANLADAYVRADGLCRDAAKTLREEARPLTERTKVLRAAIEAEMGDEKVRFVRRLEGGVIKVLKTATQTYRAVKLEAFDAALARITVRQLLDARALLACETKRAADPDSTEVAPICAWDAFHRCLLQHLKSALVVTNHSLRVTVHEAVSDGDLAEAEDDPAVATRAAELVESRAQLQQKREDARSVSARLRGQRDQLSTPLKTRLRVDRRYGCVEAARTALDARGRVEHRSVKPRAAPKMATMPAVSKPEWFRTMLSADCAQAVASAGAGELTHEVAEALVDPSVRSILTQAYVEHLRRSQSAADASGTKLVIVRPRSVVQRAKTKRASEATAFATRASASDAAFDEASVASSSAGSAERPTNKKHIRKPNIPRESATMDELPLGRGRRDRRSDAARPARAGVDHRAA